MGLRKKIVYSFLVLASFLIITFPFWGTLGQIQNKTLHQRDFLVFGTLVNIQLVGVDGKRVRSIFSQLETQYQEFHQQWHAWKPGGLLFLVNQAIKNKQPVVITPALKDIILLSQTLEHTTRGLFNASIGQMVDAWGFHKDQIKTVQPPHPQFIERLLKSQLSMKQLEIYNNTLTSKNPNVKIDLGGIAKGYIADWTKEQLEVMSVKNALINLGGDVLVMGKNSENKLWRIAIQDPKDIKKVIALVELEDGEFIATSGNYARSYKTEEHAVSHIINPNTGKPAVGVRSVSVIGNSGTRSDAFATALAVGGVDDFKALTREININLAFLIDEKNQWHLTPAFKKRLIFLK